MNLPEHALTLRRILLTRMVSLVVGTAILVGACLAVIGLKPVTERIAESHFRAASFAVETSLNALFQPAVGLLAMADEIGRASCRERV